VFRHPTDDSPGRYPSVTASPVERGDSPSEREAILSILAERIRAVDDRLNRLDEEVDPDDLEAQRMQDKWTQSLGYLAGQYRKLTNDTDIDELEEDVELLQEIADRNNR